MKQRSVKKNKRSSVQGDDGKLRIIEFLDREQKSKSEWFSRSEIAHGCSMDSDTAKELIFDMASEGWLHIRHEPGRTDVLYYRIRREGDTL